MDATHLFINNETFQNNVLKRNTTYSATERRTCFKHREIYSSISVSSSAHTTKPVMDGLMSMTTYSIPRHKKCNRCPVQLLNCRTCNTQLFSTILQGSAWLVCVLCASQRAARARRLDPSLTGSKEGGLSRRTNLLSRPPIPHECAAAAALTAAAIDAGDDVQPRDGDFPRRSRAAPTPDEVGHNAACGEGGGRAIEFVVRQAVYPIPFNS